MQGLLYVLRLGIEPIKHTGKCLRHILIFLKLTCTVFRGRNNTHLFLVFAVVRF